MTEQESPPDPHFAATAVEEPDPIDPPEPTEEELEKPQPIDPPEPGEVAQEAPVPQADVVTYAKYRQGHNGVVPASKAEYKGTVSIEHIEATASRLVAAGVGLSHFTMPDGSIRAFMGRIEITCQEVNK